MTDTERTPRQGEKPGDGGLVRLGKTSQEHRNGVWERTRQNKARRAAENRARRK